MKECGRCGIELPSDVTNGSWCVDCVDVEDLGRITVRTQAVPAGQGRYRVKSSRRGRMADRDAAVVQVRRLTEADASANQIALQLGMSTRTVERIRAESSIPVPYKNPREYVRDKETHVAKTTASLMAHPSWAA